jgi:tryptophan-rich sensory protein
MVHKINLKHLAASLAISLGTGILSSIFTMNSMKEFESANKPPLTPPNFLFPVVWTILFILMGISAYIIFESKSENRRKVLVFYGLSLVTNFFWPLLFFNLQAYLAAFVWIILLWALIIVTIVEFYKINKTAAWLQVPYLLWVTFAAYLNFGVYLLNR